MTHKEKIKHYLDLKGLSKNSFYTKTGFSTSYLESGKTIASDKIAIIVNKYPDFNMGWFLFDIGDPILSKKESINHQFILNEDSVQYQLKKDGSIVPYFNLPVSAGKSIMDVNGSIDPDGYIKDIPGTRTTEAFLPVHGYSMHPEIKEGSIIGVRKAEGWDHLNTQHKYLIITKEDRMVKYIEYDKENNDILWCKSPNYGDFNILKSDIIEIHRVTFVMNPE